MLWSSVVGSLLGKVAPEVARHYREKQEQKHEIDMERLRGKQAWEQAKTERAEMSEGRDHEWELQSLTLHSRGYKDEFVLAVVSIPAVLAFTPYFGTVESGFAALSTTPYWYQALLVSIYFAIFGIRAVRRDNQRKDLLTRFQQLEDQRD